MTNEQRHEIACSVLRGNLSEDPAAFENVEEQAARAVSLVEAICRRLERYYAQHE